MGGGRIGDLYLQNLQSRFGGFSKVDTTEKCVFCVITKGFLSISSNLRSWSLEVKIKSLQVLSSLVSAIGMGYKHRSAHSIQTLIDQKRNIL
jgi:hypothetical protein